MIVAAMKKKDYFFGSAQLSGLFGLMSASALIWRDIQVELHMPPTLFGFDQNVQIDSFRPNYFDGNIPHLQIKTTK